MNLDTIIKNGEVIDGTGQLRYKADIGISEGRIKSIGDLSGKEANQIIDATNLIVSPGFIDMHSHSDMCLFDDPGGDSKAFQGVTTEVTGNCSYSPFPRGLSDTPGVRLGWKYTWGEWTDLNGWSEQLKSHGISINVAPQLGQSALQESVGAVNEQPVTTDQMVAMKSLACEAMEQGAFAISTGLNLAPSGYMSTSEIVDLCKEIRRYNGAFYTTHARVGPGKQMSAIEEAITIGREAEIPVQFSHMAITDRRFYGRGPEMLELLENAREQGVDIVFDMYPYTAAQAGLDQMIPAWVQTGGIDKYLERLQNQEIRDKVRKEVAIGIGGLAPLWETWVVADVQTDKNKDIVGKSIADIAIERDLEPAELVLRLEEEERGVLSGVIHNREEEVIRYFLSHPLGMIGSDGNAISPTGTYSNEQLHPRFYGTYPRILGRYVREQSLLSLENAVRKMTGFPAERLGLSDRGKVLENNIADLAIFDPSTVIDNATFEKPHQLATGIHHVVVNGEFVILNEKHTGSKPGTVLKRNG